jgi:hypothetical protein
MKTSHGHLTYCSNIHPGTDWDEHFEILKENIPYIRQRLAPDQPFALGLRIANEGSFTLLESENLKVFKSWLQENNLYVFTMNGFPYGNFHGTHVKDQVHAPDWTTDERTEYTKRLFKILAELLPADMEGSISTSPLSYRYWWNSEEKLQEAVRLSTANILKVVDTLIELQSLTGKTMHLDIEPEPDGILDNGADFINWYKEVLLPEGIKYLGENYGYSEEKAKVTILTHIQLCYDVCHFAISFEKPAHILDELTAIGIRVGKIQVSSALQIDFSTDQQKKLEAVKAFVEPIYLHQVVARKADGNLEKFRDLTHGLNRWQTDHEEWRVHFHVPLFVETYGVLNSTQPQIREVLDLQKRTHFTTYLEVETYTWSILPSEMQKPLAESITREMIWVNNQL